MYDLGYLAIDTEVGGPGYFRGEHAILEIALLPFPNPTSVPLSVDDFVRKYITEQRISSYLIKPYAKVEPDVLLYVVKKPLEYYEANGLKVDVVSEGLVTLLRGFKDEYAHMVPLADWQGDPTALEYLLSLKGESMTELLGGHNMFHVKSYVKGKFGGGTTFEDQKRALGVKLMQSHEARQDCMEIAEVAVRALCHSRSLMRKESPPQRSRTKAI